MTTLLFLENLAGAKFIVAFRKRSAKALSKTATKAFKLILKQIQRFHEKLHFYSDWKKFWVVDYSNPDIDRLNRMQNLSILLNLVNFTLNGQTKTWSRNSLN